MLRPNERNPDDGGSGSTQDHGRSMLRPNERNPDDGGSGSTRMYEPDPAEWMGFEAGRQ